MATATATMISTIPHDSIARTSSSSHSAQPGTSGSSVTVPNTKYGPSANDWSSYRMALPGNYASALAGYASGSSRPYDIYRLTAHVNVDLLNFLHSNEESFEARLMAGGYVGYGSSPGARMTPNMSMHPPMFAASQSHPPSQLYVPYQPPPDEHTIRKRRRLDAFQHATLPRPSNLRPVSVEGRGRMLLDFAEDDETLRRATSNASWIERADTKTDATSESLTWPDEQFPWNLRNHERIQRERMEREHQLRRIEHFLEVASDDEDEEESVDAIYREAGYYAVAKDHPQEVEVEPSSGAASPSWMALAHGAQPDSITSSCSRAPIQTTQRLVRTNTMQLLAQRSLQKPRATEG